MECQIVLFTLLGAIAWILNGGSIFYVVRIAEYFMFFYIGAEAARQFSLESIIKAIFFVNAVVMILQSYSLIGGFTVYGWWEDVGYRVVGLTSGPWEIGLVLNLCFCALLFFPERRVSAFHATLLFAAFGYLLLLAGGRMPIIAQCAVFAYYLYKQYRRRMGTATLIVAGAGLLSITLLITNSLIFERSRSSFNWKNIDAVLNAYQALNLNRPEEFNMNLYFDAQADPSWIMRMSKWCFAFKTFVAAGLSGWLLGTGPGRFGPALDGGLLRLLTEHGIVGLMVFVSLLINMSRKNSLLMACVIAFLINAAFLDVHITYKVMALLFFTSGYYSQPLHSPLPDSHTETLPSLTPNTLTASS
jgi:hypothetical protein